MFGRFERTDLENKADSDQKKIINGLMILKKRTHARKHTRARAQENVFLTQQGA